MKTIITALALLTLFGFTDRPQQTDRPSDKIVMSEGFAARPRIIVVRKSPVWKIAEPQKQVIVGGEKEREK